MAHGLRNMPNKHLLWSSEALPRLIATSACLLPLATVHISYLISAWHAQVEWCFPYIDSCTSISNAGRKVPAQLVFKPLMAVTAVLMLAYWLLLSDWLEKMGVKKAYTIRSFRWLGGFAAIALIVYSTTLGTHEEYLRVLRRAGITLFFACSAFGHLWLVNVLHREKASLGPLPWLACQTRISYLLVLMGALSGLLSGLVPETYRHVDDAIEWSFALPMIMQFWVSGQMWRSTGYRFGSEISP